MTIYFLPSTPLASMLVLLAGVLLIAAVSTTVILATPTSDTVHTHVKAAPVSHLYGHHTNAYGTVCSWSGSDVGVMAMRAGILACPGGCDTSHVITVTHLCSMTPYAYNY